MDNFGSPAKLVVMVFSGEYDLSSKEELRAAFTSLSCEPYVVLDFSAVTYMDSTVITELLRMHHLRLANGFDRATVVAHNRHLIKLVDVLQLGSIFRVVETLDEAVGKNGQKFLMRYASAFFDETASRRETSSYG